MLFHVGATSPEADREAVYGPTLGIGVCDITGAVTTRLRVALYAKLEAPEALEELTVMFDIKPGDEKNRINPRSKGVILVAILSDDIFSAPNEVDASSITFGPNGIEASPKKCKGEDVNGDLLPDLVCLFWTREAGFESDDTDGTIQGLTVGGLPFSGTDFIGIASSKH